jgi:hypothetical protein
VFFKLFLFFFYYIDNVATNKKIKMNKKNIVLFALACGVVCQDAAGSYVKQATRFAKTTDDLGNVGKSFNSLDAIVAQATKTSKDTNDLVKPTKSFEVVVPNKIKTTSPAKPKPGLSNDAVEGVVMKADGVASSAAKNASDMKEQRKILEALLEKKESLIKRWETNPDKVQKLTQVIDGEIDALKKSIDDLEKSMSPQELTPMMQIAKLDTVDNQIAKLDTVDNPKLDTVDNRSVFSRGKEWVKNNPGEATAIGVGAVAVGGTAVGVASHNSKKNNNNSTEEQPPVEQPQVEQPQVEQPQVEQPQVEQPRSPRYRIVT